MSTSITSPDRAITFRYLNAITGKNPYYILRTILQINSCLLKTIANRLLIDTPQSTIVCRIDNCKLKLKPQLDSLPLLKRFQTYFSTQPISIISLIFKSQTTQFEFNIMPPNNGRSIHCRLHQSQFQNTNRSIIKHTHKVTPSYHAEKMSCPTLPCIYLFLSFFIYALLIPPHKIHYRAHDILLQCPRHKFSASRIQVKYQTYIVPPHNIPYYRC